MRWADHIYGYQWNKQIDDIPPYPLNEVSSTLHDDGTNSSLSRESQIWEDSALEEFGANTGEISEVTQPNWHSPSLARSKRALLTHHEAIQRLMINAPELCLGI